MTGPARNRRFGAACGLALGVLGLVAIQDLFGASRVVRAAPHKPTVRQQQDGAPAAQQPQQTPQTQAAPAAAPIQGKIQVDTTATSAASADARTVCGIGAPAADSAPAAPVAPAAPAATAAPSAPSAPSGNGATGVHSGSASAPAPWEKWCALTGTRLSATSSTDSLPVYAARVPSGAAVLVANHAAGRAVVQLGVRVTRGVYTVERCVIDLSGPAPAMHVERLESVVMGATGTIRKPGWLPPASAVLYRFTNRSAQTQSAFDAAMRAVRAVRSGHSGAYSRLMTPLSECANNVARLSDGIQPDERYSNLRYIHRALLTLAQAQALCRNFQSDGRLPGEKADSLGHALDGLEEALSELSGACLGLVPGIVVEPPSADHPNVRQVEVTVANAGSQSIAYVKIGAAAGKGCTVQPGDLAMFRELKPGEIARARFTVKLADDDDAHSIAADIAWYAAKVPARLKLRSI